MTNPNHHAQTSRTSGNPWLDYAAVVALARQNIGAAIDVVQRQTHQAEEGVTEAMYAESAVALVYARLLADDEAWWLHCCRLEVWKGRTLNRSDALLIAFKVVNGAYHGLLYERARFHAKALRETFRRHLEPERLRDYILQNHGFKRLHDAEIERERACEHLGGASAAPKESQDDNGLTNKGAITFSNPFPSSDLEAGGKPIPVGAGPSKEGAQTCPRTRETALKSPRRRRASTTSTPLITSSSKCWCFGMKPPQFLPKMVHQGSTFILIASRTERRNGSPSWGRSYEGNE